MDRVIEKTKSQRLMKYWPYAAIGSLLLAIGLWLLFCEPNPNPRGSKKGVTLRRGAQA